MSTPSIKSCLEEEHNIQGVQWKMTAKFIKTQTKPDRCPVVNLCWLQSRTRHLKCRSVGQPKSSTHTQQSLQCICPVICPLYLHHIYYTTRQSIWGMRWRHTMLGSITSKVSHSTTIWADSALRYPLILSTRHRISPSKTTPYQFILWLLLYAYNHFQVKVTTFQVL